MQVAAAGQAQSQRAKINPCSLALTGQKGQISAGTATYIKNTRLGATGGYPPFDEDIGQASSPYKPPI
jgi:hypothetical protein